MLTSCDSHSASAIPTTAAMLTSAITTVRVRLAAAASVSLDASRRLSRLSVNWSSEATASRSLPLITASASLILLPPGPPYASLALVQAAR